MHQLNASPYVREAFQHYTEDLFQWVRKYTYYDPDGVAFEDRIRTDGAEIRREVSRAVSVAILRQASEQGKCLV